MNRLKELRMQKGLLQKDIAQIFHIAVSTYSYWEKGTFEPDSATYQKLADYFGVSVDYLLGRNSIDISAIKKDLVIKDEVDLNDMYPIPLLGSVVAGIPIESQEDLEGYIYINYKPKEEYFALRVHGESMINAGIRDKSILVVHKQSYAENGEIVVAMLNGEQTVKRFKRYNADMIFLMPENPTFDPIPVSQKDSLLILGKVIEMRMSF